MTPANDNAPAVYAGLNAGGGHTVYDHRKGKRPVIDFYTETDARKFVEEAA